MSDESRDEVDVAPAGLEGLRLQAPPDTLDRFRRRASLWRRTRYVLERQLYAFWIVLNTLLRLLFKRGGTPVGPPGKQQAGRYRRLLQNSKDERP